MLRRSFTRGLTLISIRSQPADFADIYAAKTLPKPELSTKSTLLKSASTCPCLAARAFTSDLKSSAVSRVMRPWHVRVADPSADPTPWIVSKGDDPGDVFAF